MRNIHKFKEPRCLVEHRCSKDACYENIPTQTRQILKQTLLQEQGYICAYCMGRISENNMKIEHVASRHEHPELQLTYSNLVACCLGNEGAPFEKTHCDTSKKSKSLSKNPAIPKYRIEESIQYYPNGTIYSTDSVIDTEINEILHLNLGILCNNRKAVMTVVRKTLSSLPTNATYGEIEKILQKWENQDDSKKYKPYAGIAIFFLKKRLRNSH